jgi:hypothetical protein
MPPFTWTNVTTGIGWFVAFIVAILAVIFWVQGSISKEAAMVTLAVCAVRL